MWKRYGIIAVAFVFITGPGALDAWLSLFERFSGREKQVAVNFGAWYQAIFPILGLGVLLFGTWWARSQRLGEGKKATIPLGGVTFSAGILRAPTYRGYCAKCGAQGATSPPCLVTEGNHDILYYEDDVFCKRCGIRAGKATRCIKVNGEHDFKDYPNMVYCESCGMRAGDQSKCIAVNGEHQFKYYAGMVWCSLCRILAGSQTICAKTRAEHHFVGI